MRLKKSIKRGIAAVTITGIMASSAMPAFAKDYHIDYGDIKVDQDKVSYTDKDGTKYDNEKNEDGDITITGKSDENTVSVKDADVTFKDLEIDRSASSTAADGAAVSVSGNSSIELDGKNTISSGMGHAGIEKADDNGTMTIKDDNNVSGSLTANGGFGGAGIGGGNNADGSDITITGGNVTANGGGHAAGIGGGSSSYSGGGNGSDITISGGNVTANGGTAGAGIGGGYGGGYAGLGDVTIEGNTMVNATGGAGAAGIGSGVNSVNDTAGNGNKITIRSNESGAPTVNATGGKSGIDEETEKKISGGAGIGSGAGDAKANITLEGKVTIVAKAGDGNVAIGDMNGEQEFNGLAEGSSITRYDSKGNDTTLPTDPGYPVPADTSSSGGSSADASVQESVFPGLVVTDKDGQRISYTSTQSGNTLTVCVGRLTASLHVSLAALRQLRAEGIETIAFQTVLCSTTLSVDELLAMGGEDAEAVLTHRLTASSLTVS